MGHWAWEAGEALGWSIGLDGTLKFGWGIEAGEGRLDGALRLDGHGGWRWHYGALEDGALELDGIELEGH